MSDQAPSNTLMQFLQDNRWIGFFFDDPKHIGQAFGSMNQQFKDGDYQLTDEQMDSATILGQEIIAMAKAKNVDLTKFPEIKAAMGYDKDAKSLTAEELGAFMVGYAMQNSTRIGQFVGTLTSDLSADQNRIGPAATDLAVELGRQVYGDTNTSNSSVNTTTDKSMDKINNNPDVPRARC